MPRVKRKLGYRQPDSGESKPGMRGAVEFGTAHRARDDGDIAGKTGTCSENHTHLGWFGSFNDVGQRKLVVVVLLTGGSLPSDRWRRESPATCTGALGEKNYLPGRSPGDPGDAGIQPSWFIRLTARRPKAVSP